MHPMVKIRKYAHGFSQPAVFVYDREGSQRFSWRQRPRLVNYFGAARRIEPRDILEEVKKIANG